MELKLDKDKYKQLEHSYFCCFSDEIPNELFRDYKLIVEHRTLLKQCKPTKQILKGLVDTVCELIADKKRFQKGSLIRLIRHHLIYEFIDEKLTDKLFFIFKKLLLDVNEDLAWSVSSLIKGIHLKQEQIDWLIVNQDISEHVINRLLRYPFPNKTLADWAVNCINNKSLSKRLSELISLILNVDRDYLCNDSIAQLWGIHYSQLSDNLKKELLFQYLAIDNLEEFLKICERNNYNDLIAKTYNDIAI